MQTYTSKATSINKNKLPAVYNKVRFNSRIILDYGCGRYTDHIRKHLAESHVYLSYDPYNQPEDVNNVSMFTVQNAIKSHTPVDVVLSNVLNVINDDWTILGIADVIELITEKTGGTGYVTVYEGNHSGIGKQTGKDQYQRNEPLRSYLKYFKNAKIKNGMIVING